MNQIPNIEETHNTREVEEIVDKKLKQISNYIFSRSISLQDSAKYERQVWIDTLHQQLQSLHTSLVAAVEGKKRCEHKWGQTSYNCTKCGIEEHFADGDIDYNNALNDTLTIINSIFKE